MVVAEVSYGVQGADSTSNGRNPSCTFTSLTTQLSPQSSKSPFTHGRYLNEEKKKGRQGGKEARNRGSEDGRHMKEATAMNSKEHSKAGTARGNTQVGTPREEHSTPKEQHGGNRTDHQRQHKGRKEHRTNNGRNTTPTTTIPHHTPRKQHQGRTHTNEHSNNTAATGQH